ncbi:MAG: ankyrin repeat domain-containing protein [Acidobacteria bacterium]|nr:MAG: ankyrin repeat domain-containing protein [Acidobacteriota bacterium]REK02835.1 MAG: ankyrin repeat domain-containing protein [Acidobacteriota bacterium]REK13361.1 MAG: ankyrin repeat domain-containing protein [Acidobacteriota bacterium]
MRSQGSQIPDTLPGCRAVRRALIAFSFLLFLCPFTYSQIPARILSKELALAARNGDVEKAKLLLNEGAKADSRDHFGQPAIVLAGRMRFEDRNLEVIELLANKGADINSSNDFGTTPLMMSRTSSRYANSEKFFKMLGADFSKKDKFGGDYWVYHLFGTDREYPPSIPNSERMVLKERDVIWRFILEANLAKLENPRCCGRWINGATPVMALAYYDYSYIFEESTRREPELLTQTDDLKRTPVHYAALGNCSRCLYLGFDTRTANLNSQHSGGQTPIILASIYGHDEFIERALRIGGDPNITDRMGMTALSYAAAYGRHDSVLALLFGGADSEEAMYEGEPALVFAARTGKEKVVGAYCSVKASSVVALTKERPQDTEDSERPPTNELKRRLKNLSALDLDVAGREGMTALMWAAEIGSLKMAQMLLIAGADHRRRNYEGKTSMDIAREKGYEEIVRVLAEAENLAQS